MKLMDPHVFSFSNVQWCFFVWSLLVESQSVLCLSFLQNIQKMLGLAPSRAATKQAGGFLGPPPQAAKFS